MDYIREAKALVQNLNQRMGPSPYDIAWLARLRAAGEATAYWPDLTDWLLEHQHPDGSWGGQIIYYHDRIICTLAAIIALYENRHTHSVEEAIKRAERFLWLHLHLLYRDPFELVGFELIFPTLLLEARALGLDVPSHTCGYGEIQTAKLRMIPPEMLYSPRITTAHSLEFLGQAGNPAKLHQAMTVNGSLGNSPAATAYYLLMNHQDERALAYLRSVQEHMGYIVYLYPFSTFELSWVLNNLAFSGAPVTEFVTPEIWGRLRAEMGPAGVGLDPTFGIPDADTTSVTLYLLLKAGYDIDPGVLAQFEDKGKKIFRTYHYERNPSVSTNVHALEVLHLLPDYPDCSQVKEQVILTLLEQRKFNIYWTDKWHSSPYYATSHALITLLKEKGYLAIACQQTVDWILHTQHDDGSWGFFQIGTAEETAYAMMALLHYSHYGRIDPDILRRGAAYLAQRYEQGDSAYPELWLGKDLYSPRDVVRSAILSALILYERTMNG